MSHRSQPALLALAVLLTFAFFAGLLSPDVRAEDTGVPQTTSSTELSPSQAKAIKMLGGGPEQITLTSEEAKFVTLTNAERKSRKLNELAVAPLLVMIAREKSKEMYELNYWGHVSPVKEKQTAMRRVLYYLPEPPKSMIVGENLFFCSEVRVEEGHKALMNSPTHRANILKPEYEYVGIGAYTAPDGRFWTTEIFLKIEY